MLYNTNSILGARKRFVTGQPPSRPVILFSNRTLNGCSPYVTSSHLSFTITVGPHQRSRSRVPVLQDSGPNFTVSASRLPGPCIYSPQEQGNPVIPLGTGF
jgi:hypothetical protein